MLCRHVGFQWNNTSFEEECQVSGKKIRPGIGFTPVIADVPGLMHCYVDPGILRKYAAPAHRAYTELRSSFPSDAPKSVLQEAPEGISHVYPLHIPTIAPELEAVFALMADEIIGFCYDKGIALSDVDNWEDTDFIAPTVYYDVLRSYGFIFDTVDDEQKARDLLERIVKPIVFSSYVANYGHYNEIEYAVNILQSHGYIDKYHTKCAINCVESFV